MSEWRIGGQGCLPVRLASKPTSGVRTDYLQNIQNMPSIIQQASSERHQDAWYAMRVTYNRALIARALLDREEVKNFIPMKCVEKVVGRRKVRQQVPAIGNLIFVYSNLQRIREIKEKMDYLQYLVNSRTKEKIVVPQDQMQRFIAIAGSSSDKLLWFNPDEINLTKGMRVRITDGEFKDYEGVLVKVKGARDKRVVVAIEGVIAVAMATIHPSLLEPVA